MQVMADWREQMTAAKFNETFKNLSFSGPGFYLSKTDTVLVVPNPPESTPTADNVWNYNQPPGTLLDVYVYNVPFNETIFYAPASAAPCRQGER